MKSKLHIVFAWELGAGYGHIAGVKPLLTRLLDAGFRISVIARYINTAESLLNDIDVTVYQAPRWNGRGGRSDATYTFPEILLGFGYSRATDLGPMVKGWTNLFDLLQPDLVLVDHGPTAILACRCQRRIFATFGTGFFVPPNVARQPVFPGMKEPEDGRCEESELQVLGAINGVLGCWDHEPLSQFAGLFHPGEHFLCTFPELDHFPGRPNAHYVGARFDSSSGAMPTWPEGKDRRVFAYIKEESEMFNPAWQALRALDASILMHVPAPSAQLSKTVEEYPNIHLSPTPIRMNAVYEEADLVICHAGHGVIAGALLAGRRLLLIPEMLEQSILTLLLTQQRLAMAVKKGDDAKRLGMAMEAALQAPVLGENAAKFAQRHSDFNQRTQLASLVESCRSLIS